MRIWIAGVPGAGKSTLGQVLSEQHRLDLLHTDDLRELPWEDVPHRLIGLVSGRDGYVLEGVQVGRMVRKAGELRSSVRPDRVIWMPTPRRPLVLAGQRSMAQGVRSIWTQASQVLAAWGVEVETL